MTIKLILAAAALSGGAALNAATLNVATAVQSRPDASSPVIAILPAGSEQPAVSDKASPPPGWIAVDLTGPFQGYVKNKDLTKQLDITPGSSIYLSPKDEGSAFATFEKGDKADITGLHGKWTQITLQKPLVGFIQGSAVASSAPVAAAPEQAPAPAPSAPSAAPAPASPPTEDAGLSKLFEGTLTGTRTLLMPKKPYDWQLVDADGKRVAYLDLSKLLLTDQIDNYAGHSVVVLGFLESVKGTSDLVVHAEGLRLK